MATAVAQTSPVNTSNTSGGWSGGSGTGGRPGDGDTIDLNGKTVTLDTTITQCVLVDNGTPKGSLTINSSSYPPDGWTFSDGTTVNVVSTCSFTGLALGATISGVVNATALFSFQNATVTITATGKVYGTGAGRLQCSGTGELKVYGVWQNDGNLGALFGTLHVYDGGTVQYSGNTPGNIGTLIVDAGATYTATSAPACSSATLAVGSIVTLHGVRLYPLAPVALMGGDQ